MDNVKLVWDSNFMLSQSLCSSNRYSTVLFVMPSLPDTWWNMERLFAEKALTNKSVKTLKVNIRLCTNEMHTLNYWLPLLFIED